MIACEAGKGGPAIGVKARHAQRNAGLGRA